jgi:hypothetical protein
MLDLCHVIPREIVREFAGNVRDVDGADLAGTPAPPPAASHPAQNNAGAQRRRDRSPG